MQGAFGGRQFYVRAEAAEGAKKGFEARLPIDQSLG